MRILFLLFITCQFSFGQTILKTRIDSLLSVKSQTPFNGIVLISQNETAHYIHVKGFSDILSQTPLSVKDQFVIGSISKQFTAVLILQQFDKRRLKLDVPIRKYLPELKQSWSDTITIHHLLTHTHGIQNLQKATAFKAGSQYAYSQLGYDLLARIAERVSKKTFVQLAQELFRKCNMIHTFHPDEHKYHLVKGYTEQFNGRLRLDSSSLDNYPAAGGFISTVEDLDSWNHYLHEGKLLKASTYHIMITKQSNAVRQHPIFGLTEYGYGLTVNEEKNIVQLGQTGFVPGFVSMNFYYPESKTSIIVLENVVYGMNNLKQSFYYHLEILKLVKEDMSQ